MGMDLDLFADLEAACQNEVERKVRRVYKDMGRHYWDSRSWKRVVVVEEQVVRGRCPLFG
jgi:hypothetical protein